MNDPRTRREAADGAEAESAAAPSHPNARKSPPRVFFAACGALCDVFWWARRKSDSDPAD